MKLNLFWDYENKTFVRSQTDATPITLPKLYQWTTPSIVMTLLAPNPTGGMNAPFTKLTDLTGVSVQIGIGNPKGTNAPAALCSLAADDTAKTMNGTLTLGTTQINAMLGTELEAEAFMEVVVSKSGALDRGQSPVVLRACLIDPSSTPPTPTMETTWRDYMFDHLYPGAHITISKIQQGSTPKIYLVVADPPTPTPLPVPTEEIIMRGNGIGGVYYTVPGRQMALEVSTFSDGEWSEFVDVHYPADGDGYLASHMTVTGVTQYRLRAKTLWGTVGPVYEFTTADVPVTPEQPGITGETGYAFYVVVPNLPGDALNWTAVQCSIDGGEYFDASGMVPDLTPGASNRIVIPLGETHSYSFRMAASNVYGQGPFSAGGGSSGTGVLPSAPDPLGFNSPDGTWLEITMPSSLPANADGWNDLLCCRDGEWGSAAGFGITIDLTSGATTRFYCPSGETHTYYFYSQAYNPLGATNAESTTPITLTGGS